MHNENSLTSPGRTGAGIFFAFTFGWSILFWSLTIILGGIEQFPGSILMYAGGAGPIVAALVLVHVFEPLDIQRDFWVRTFDPRRMTWLWLAASLLLHPLLIAVAIAAEVGLGGELVLNTAQASTLAGLASLVFFVFVFGPLPEEMGWRGVALDRLQSRMSPLAASLILGVAWSCWHIPLFFIDGTFQSQLGVFSFRFWVFMLDMIPLTIIMHWIYNNTNRSTLSAVLVHFSGNMCGALLIKSDRLSLLELVCLSVVALIILVQTRARLGYKREAGMM